MQLDQVTFLTAHNAYANGVDGGFAPPFVDLFPNQNRGIQQQLADGVRGFMLDIHQTPDGAILCHNSCTLVRRPVALWVDLQRIVDFLRAHPDECVTVCLEDSSTRACCAPNSTACKGCRTCCTARTAPGCGRTAGPRWANWPPTDTGC
ncbi:hypothetical protein SALBM217S_03488 [Streptomyces griseoloalbus]